MSAATKPSLSGALERFSGPTMPARFQPDGHTSVAAASATPPSAPPAHARFEVLRRIGEGGHGIVYLALDRDYEAQVALKTRSPR